MDYLTKGESHMNDSEKNKYNIMKSVFSLSMLDKFPCGIIVIRRKSNYKILYLNQFLKNLLGYSDDDAKKVISKDNILQFIPVSERVETEKKISQVESGGVMVECSIHLFRKNGSLCPVTCLISSGHENDLSGTIHCIILPRNDEEQIIEKKMQEIVSKLAFDYDEIIKVDLQMNQIHIIKSLGQEKKSDFLNVSEFKLNAVFDLLHKYVFKDDIKIVDKKLEFLKSRIAFPDDMESECECRLLINDKVKWYVIVVIPTETYKGYICCKDITYKRENALLKAENKKLSELRDAGNAYDEEAVSVRIYTFGYFAVFVNGIPVLFTNKKAKELLALLVDRKGNFVASKEAASILWDDELLTDVVLARYRKVALQLKRTLENYGVGYLVETVNGQRRILKDKVSCDLYDFLDADNDDKQFSGFYMTDYSWGEVTLGELQGKSEKDKFLKNERKTNAHDTKQE